MFKRVLSAVCNK